MECSWIRFRVFLSFFFYWLLFCTTITLLKNWFTTPLLIVIIIINCSFFKLRNEIIWIRWIANSLQFQLFFISSSFSHFYMTVSFFLPFLILFFFRFWKKKMIFSILISGFNESRSINPFPKEPSIDLISLNYSVFKKYIFFHKNWTRITPLHAGQLNELRYELLIIIVINHPRKQKVNIFFLNFECILFVSLL